MTMTDDNSILHVNQRTERVRVTKTWEVDAEVEDTLRVDGTGIACRGWLVSAETLMGRVDADNHYTLTIERIEGSV